MSKVKWVDRVAGAVARTLGSDPGRHTDPGVPKHSILRSLKDLFLAIFQTFPFFFFLFSSVFRERMFDLSLDSSMNGAAEHRCAPLTSGVVSNFCLGLSRSSRLLKGT